MARTKFPRRPVQFGNPRRCPEHLHVSKLDASAGDQNECAICVATKVCDRFIATHFWTTLDAYADRLTHHATLRAKLRDARVRLDMLSPGAGDFLANECDEPLVAE